MSALKRPYHCENDSIWRKNAATIRQLYQEERKTLKEVKAIMENEQRFPVIPLSIWETKLREFGMQKNLKASDWAVVYQHVRPRLRQGGAKKLGKPTVILINGTKKPWDKCWKEMRRNRALNREFDQGRLPPLPRGIVVRTPSPEPEDSSRKRHLKSPQLLISQLFQTTLVSLQPLIGLDTHSNIEISDNLKYPESVYRLCLEGIPFTRLLEKMSDISTRALPSNHCLRKIEQRQHEGFPSALNPVNSHASTQHTIKWRSQLAEVVDQLLSGIDSASPIGQDLRSNFDSYHYLSMIIYLLSNTYIPLYPFSQGKGDLNAILEMTFRFVSRRVLLALLQSRLPSVKAAWEKLLLGAGIFKNKEAFKVLVSTGIGNDWLEEPTRGHEHLFYAIQNNCDDILNALLARGCRVDSCSGPYQTDSAIMAALENGSLNCAKILIQHCNVNQEFWSPFWDHVSTNFVTFIIGFDYQNPDHHQCLSLFLEQGADVDYEIDPHHLVERNIRYWDKAETYGLMEGWPLSILDYVFYFHRALFPKLAVLSKVSSRFSRARALRCLEEGVHVLLEYLEMDLVFANDGGECIGIDPKAADVHDWKNYCLEVLLAEQFLLSLYIPNRKLCWMTVQRLSHLGIDLTWSSTREGLAADILNATACLLTSGEESDEENGLRMMQWLLDQGFQVRSNALSAAVQDNGAATLRCLTGHCSDVEKYGAHALAEAASRNNFEATRFLLDAGVDPNSIIVNANHGKTSVLGAAARASSLAMLKYLVQHGARSTIRKEHPHPSDLLLHMLWDVEIIGSSQARTDDLLIKVEYIIEEVVTITEPFCPSALLLEACLQTWADDLEERKLIFELLFNKGSSVGPGSPLAEWIAARGGHQLTQKMLDAGADPDAYSLEKASEIGLSIHNRRIQTPLQAAAGQGDLALVCLLLERGADVNKPALGNGGMTALHAICAWDPVSAEEVKRKENIVKLLLEKGAEINAANSKGWTALTFAAWLGDLATCFLLLKYGAQVNRVSSTESYSPAADSVLDVAARNGRLDMVDFLLNANALSSSAGIDGEDYEWAIRLARENGHFIVAELICKHSSDRRREWTVPNRPVVETPPPQEHTLQSLPLRGGSGVEAAHQNERQLGSSEIFADDEMLGKPRDLCDGVDEPMIDCDNITPGSITNDSCTAEGDKMDFTWTCEMEEIEGEPPLADLGSKEPLRREGFDTKKASLGQGGHYQPGGLSWAEDEHQNLEAPETKRLIMDVFMGFSGLQSL